MTVTKNHSRFEGPWRNANAPVGGPSRFGGVSTAAVFDADWFHYEVDMGNIADRLKIASSASAPVAATDGTEWEVDNIGGAPTLSFIANLAPPRFSIVTPAVDGQGWQAQRSVVAGTALTCFDPGTCQEMYMYMVCRISDVVQSQLAMLFAPVDTSLLTAVPNAVGLHKPDGAGNLFLVSDDDDVALGSYSNRKAVKNLSTGSRTGTPANTIWLGLGFQAVFDESSIVNDKGVLHAFYDNGKRSSNHSDGDPTHCGSMAMVESPNIAVPLAPSIAFAAGEAVAKTLLITKIMMGGKYRYGLA
jgi:hypothetical protein